MGDTIIDGGGQWTAIAFESLVDKTAVVTDLKIQGYNIGAITALDGHTDFTISRVEIDASNATSNGPIFGGIGFTTSGNSTIDNVYIHDIVSNLADVGTAGIALIAGGNFSGAVSVSNTTIENIGATQLSNSSSDGITVLSGIIDGSYSPGNLDFNLTNTTIKNIHSATAGANGVGVIGVVDDGASLINIVAKNNTITELSGLTSVYGEPASFSLAGAANQDSDDMTIHLDSTNNVLDSKDTSSQNCSLNNLNSLIPGANGSVDLNIMSNGGNLSSDDTCSPYLTSSSDQNNVNNLNLTLGPLSDNGGYVPTIPLLENSPAVDSGVIFAGITTDARLAIRPQGNAYDSGAYESPFTKPAATDNSDESLAETGQSNNTVLTLATLIVVVSALALFIRSALIKRKIIFRA